MEIVNTVLSRGIITRESALRVFEHIFGNEGSKELDLSELHCMFYPEEFNNFRNLPKITKKSNCKLLFIHNHIKYFLYKDMPGTTFNDIVIPGNLIGGNLGGGNLRIEYIVDVYVNVLLRPLFELRDCDNLDEALMCWSLNNRFSEADSNNANVAKTIQSRQHELSTFQKQILFPEKTGTTIFKKQLDRLLNHKYIHLLVPSKFIIKIKTMHKAKHVSEITVCKFLDIVTNIHVYFKKKVKRYHERNIKGVKREDLDFPIELYGRVAVEGESKLSLHFAPFEGCVHYKSTAILNNMRWFFNTRYNSKEVFGLDGEFGRGLCGYGQTFHKYVDMILFLVSNPNTYKHCELVVLDPIPSEFIFKKSVS
ncbi:hypothetical protein DH26_gp101 [Chloriridovirus anopheles1]|uniref:Uncharacterized protein n=1 Tax=Chloriridovirus anopheles1 TaxID=1465751 RepID=W8QF49_9VIRU|nr:hypothetical protein DH26_gp101 [Anopheles minimus iridovirus]AHL67594.1 hypothetical protein AMIV_101 [Anopheles minimus iridovirus]